MEAEYAMTSEADETSPTDLHQIGDVADAVGLSLRTVRYYEEVGLLESVSRSDGGFRLYGEDQITQLRLIKRMKPLGLSLEEMRALLHARQLIQSGEDDKAKAEARVAMERFAKITSDRCVELEQQLRDARDLAAQISAEAKD